MDLLCNCSRFCGGRYLYMVTVMEKRRWIIWLTMLQNLEAIADDSDVSAFEEETSRLLKKFKQRKKTIK